MWRLGKQWHILFLQRDKALRHESPASCAIRMRHLRHSQTWKMSPVLDNGYTERSNTLYEKALFLRTDWMYRQEPLLVSSGYISPIFSQYDTVCVYILYLDEIRHFYGMKEMDSNRDIESPLYGEGHISGMLKNRVKNCTLTYVYKKARSHCYYFLHMYRGYDGSTRHQQLSK